MLCRRKCTVVEGRSYRFRVQKMTYLSIQSYCLHVKETRAKYKKKWGCEIKKGGKFLGATVYIELHTPLLTAAWILGSMRKKKEVLNERATADIGNGGSSPTSLLLATAPADGRHNPESKQDIFRFTTCQFASAHAILKRLPRQCFPTQEWDRVTQPRHRRHKTPQIFLSDPTALWDGKSKRERIYLLAHACISIPNPPNVISIKKTRLVCKIRISIQ